ncbi:hypothetical protein E2562_026135 [Oryza meyeriana var. granulata]|uniref:Uncharacterized protein n=1 Tax=Oryza meyeriana var. granulata TaxID=110450 RepID=A0A6G1FCI1_9ORYZ|nr:hypothetical protein E2562_026135 [Oryza meyeriana var. granulata]
MNVKRDHPAAEVTLPPAPNPSSAPPPGAAWFVVELGLDVGDQDDVKELVLSKDGEGQRAKQAEVHNQELALVEPHRPHAVGVGPGGLGGGKGGVASFHGADEVPKGLHPVYVGKSRRRYLIAEELVGYPLFQNLVDRTGGGGEAGGATVVGCEVMLFEHLLWMLENADPQPESLDELVEYYAC